MGANRQKKLEKTDVLYLHITVRVEVTVPTSDALLIPRHQRRGYGCNFIDEVQPGGLRSVIITATDCTPVEAVNEYISIANKLNGHADDGDSRNGENEI